MPLLVLEKLFKSLLTVIDAIYEGKKLRAKMYMSAHTKTNR